MTDYLRHLASKTLNIEKAIAPRVPAFFEPAAFTGSAYNGGSYLESGSLSEKQEALFKSKKERLHDETEYNRAGKPMDGMSLERNYLGPSSIGASAKASDQSLISGQFEGGGMSSSLSPVYAEPHIRFRNVSQLPKSFGFRNSKYISTNKKQIAPRKIEPQKSDLFSGGSAKKAEDPNSDPFESDLKNRSFDLGESELDFQCYMHKPDLPGRGPETHHRVRWGTGTHQQKQDSSQMPKSDVHQLDLPEKKHKRVSSKTDGFQSDGWQVEQKQNKRIYPGNFTSSKKSHSSFANMIDLRPARAPSKRAVWDQSQSRSLEDADLEIGIRKPPILRESLLGVMVDKAARSGSILQEASRRSQKVISSQMDSNTINEQLMGVLPSQETTGQKKGHSRDLSSPNSSPHNDGITEVKIRDLNRRGLEKASIARFGSMITQSEETLLKPPERQFLPHSNGAKSTIHVTIGRIELKAERPHHMPSAPIVSSPSSTRLSLDEYLKQRSTGQL